jgi:acetyl esterase/lipase
VTGSIREYDASARALAHLANAIVVSVGYRLAPEHRFPVAHADALAAYRWVVTHGASIRGDTSKVALAGEGAGGNLAVATAMAARDSSLQQPACVIAIYPIASGDTLSASYVVNAHVQPLDRAMMSWFFSNEITGPGDLADPRINLIHANLHGLPPTTVITDQIDPLHSEGQILSQRMASAGVDVRYRNYDGVTHGFFGLGAVVDRAREANQFAADGLKLAFSR